MLPIWDIYSHLPIFEKYFPRKVNTSDIEYQTELLQIPGLIKTKLRIDDWFLLPDEELRNHIIVRIYVLHHRKNIKYFTRLTCFYYLQLNRETKDEFYEYINRFPIENCCGILSTLTLEGERMCNDYFAQRWKKDPEDYRMILAEMEKIDEYFYVNYAPQFLVVVFQHYTKENNMEELEYLISLGEKIEETNDVFAWIDAIVPYGSEKMISFLMTKEDTEVINLIYDCALEVSENRLKEIIEILNEQGISYQTQLDEYLENEDWESPDPGYEHSNMKNFIIIVSNLVKLGNIQVSKMKVREGSKFEIFVDMLENQV